MITVTQEMVTAFMDAGTGGYGDVVDAKDGLEAVMALIDPVPDEVQKLYIKKNDDEFWRVRPGGNVWRHECGCCYSTTREVFESADDMGGQVTW